MYRVRFTISKKYSFLKINKKFFLLIIFCLFFHYFLFVLVIYDNDITDVFIQTIFRLFKISASLENFYVALEKRYVFTIDDLNAVAPMYFYFTETFGKACQAFNNSSSSFKLKLVDVNINFPQFFEYDRCKELVLMNIVKEKC